MARSVAFGYSARVRLVAGASLGARTAAFDYSARVRLVAGASLGACTAVRVAT